MHRLFNCFFSKIFKFYLSIKIITISQNISYLFLLPFKTFEYLCYQLFQKFYCIHYNLYLFLPTCPLLVCGGSWNRLLPHPKQALKVFSPYLWQFTPQYLNHPASSYITPLHIAHSTEDTHVTLRPPEMHHMYNFLYKLLM